MNGSVICDMLRDLRPDGVNENFESATLCRSDASPEISESTGGIDS